MKDCWRPGGGAYDNSNNNSNNVYKGKNNKKGKGKGKQLDVVHMIPPSETDTEHDLQLFGFRLATERLDHGGSG